MVGGQKWDVFFKIENKNGENKKYGPKWELRENIETKKKKKKKKKLFSPKNYVRKEASTRELTTNREVK